MRTVLREGVGVIAEHRLHLLGRLEEELVAGVPEPLRVVHGLAGADAQQDVVRLGIALAEVVHVVGRHQREIQLPGQRQDALVDDLLILDPLVLHLEEEVAGPEDIAQAGGGLERGPGLLDLECAGHFALEAAAQADEPLGVLGQQVLVDARAIVEPFRVTRRTTSLIRFL